jgi:hypothetical protein
LPVQEPVRSMELTDFDPARYALFESRKWGFGAHIQRNSFFRLESRYEEAWEELDLSGCFVPAKLERFKDAVVKFQAAGLVRDYLQNMQQL